MRIKNGNETRSGEFWRPGIGIPKPDKPRGSCALKILLAIIPAFPPSETLQSFARGGDQTIIDTKDEDLCKAAVQEGLDQLHGQGNATTTGDTQKPPRRPVEPLRAQPRNGERRYFHLPACRDRFEGEDALMAVNAF
jgi:hypothetical protein